MSKEIELKAHVFNLEKTLCIVRNTHGINHECFLEKKDVYLKNYENQPACRVRLERIGPNDKSLTDNVWITVKDKKSINGIEVNEEIEIDSSSSNFEKSVTLFKYLGYKEFLTKEKRGYSFIFDKFKFPLHIEILEVKPLGWFIEMEFTPEGVLSDKEIAIAKNDLLVALKLFNIEKSAIEKRFYCDLLDNKKRN